MTKKDYVLLARVLGEATAADCRTREEVLQEVTRLLVWDLKSDNPQFDATRFRAEVQRVAEVADANRRP